MSERLWLARDVWENVKSLREVTNVLGLHEKGGLTYDERKFRVTWARLERSLRDALEVMHSPIAGQGLVALWLKEICARAVRIDACAKRFSNGFADVFWHDNNDLLWIVTHGWEVGHRILVFSNKRFHGFASILEKAKPPYQLFFELYGGQDWRRKNLPDLPDERLESEAGRLFLESIDDLYFSTAVLGETMAQSVLNYFENPAGVLRSYMGSPGALGMSKLASHFTSLHSNGDEAGVGRKQGVAESRELSSYPLPASYARDKWIYENFEKQDCHSLALKLKKIAPRRKWTIIISRNALKNAADRYAKYHNLPFRRFPDPRVVS